MTPPQMGKKYLIFVHSLEKILQEAGVESSRPEELPLWSLTEPYVTLSRHTALVIQPYSPEHISSAQTT